MPVIAAVLMVALALVALALVALALGASAPAALAQAHEKPGSDGHEATRQPLQLRSAARPDGGAWSADVRVQPAGGRAKAVSWRTTGDANRTQVRIEINQQISANMFLLDEPYRAIIDVPSLDFQLPPGLGARGAGLVRSFRYGQFGAGRSRIVIDLAGPAAVENAQFAAPGSGPGVLSFDLVKTSAAQFSALLGPAPASNGQDPLKSSDSVLRGGRHDEAMAARKVDGARSNKPVVVIDPGHGGIDPGTVASPSVTEKAVTLAVALQIRNILLQNRRYDVHLTRSNDMFVSLEQRVKVSRQVAADLFVSIHADSLAEREMAQSISGATVYILSDRASDERSRRMAEKENAADVLAGLSAVPASAEEQVRNILLDLVQRETSNNSISFRNAVLGQMKGKVPLAKDPQRSAAFKVLRQAETPAVLIELGYMSNAVDLARLLKPEGQRQLAQTIVASIDAFFAQRAKRQP